MSASADRTACVWDSETCKREMIVREHTGIVNDVDVSATDSDMFVTASDDKSSKIFDVREGRKSMSTFKSLYQLTSVCLNHSANLLYTAGVSCEIDLWDLRKPDDKLLTIEGHRGI